MPLNRRQFLISSAALVAGCAAPRETSHASGAGERLISIGPAAQYLNDGVYTNHRNQGFFLVRHGAVLFAVSSICTHRRCKLEAEPNKTFYCPCHGSTFDGSGKVLTGPARRDLPIFELSHDEQGNFLVKIPAA